MTDIPEEVMAEARITKMVVRAIMAERERCAKIARAYADENLTMAGDEFVLSQSAKGDAKAVLVRTSGAHGTAGNIADLIATAIRRGEA